jgi:hypothetical protein
MRINIAHIAGLLFIIMLATNNALNFKDNILKLDLWFIGAIIFATLLAASDIKLAKSLGGSF